MSILLYGVGPGDARLATNDLTHDLRHQAARRASRKHHCKAGVSLPRSRMRRELVADPNRPQGSFIHVFPRPWPGGGLLENNLFVGRHEGLPQGITTVPTAPPIAGPPVPSENPDWLETLRPIPNRPFPRGKIIENPGTRDFFGTPLPIGKPLAIGAAEPRP